MRLASRAFARRIRLALLAAAAIGACTRGDQIAAEWVIAPAAPAIGTITSARVTLRDAGNHPVVGAHLQLEAHMSHPGMAPVVTPVMERSDGVYEGQVQFTMAGDWVLVLSGTLSDGTRLTRTLQVAGIRPPG